MGDPYAHPFLELAAACRPAWDEMLIGIEREFRAVDREAVDRRLDDLARGLFEVGSDAAPDEWVLALARSAWSVLPLRMPAVARSSGCWLVCVTYNGVAADVGGDPLYDQFPAVTGRFCAHGAGLLALTGLAAAWRARGDSLRARRASGLRLLLPLDQTIRTSVEADVRRERADA